jgi:hypothetical protein
MGRYVVEVTAESAAEPGAIWRVLADHTSWQEWGPYTKTFFEREGDPPEGVGAIRVYAVGPFHSREEVVAFDAPQHLAYTILSGFPAKDYRADVTLEALGGGGTRIHWHATFDPKPPGTGWLLRILLMTYLSFLAKKVGRIAER